MSRIHEALKRVAAERQPEAAGKTPASSLDRVASLTMEILATPRSAMAVNAPASSPLQELRQQCAQPGWSLGIRENVFAAAPTLCAEQFRKLRSRLYQMRSAEPLGAVQVTSSLPGEGKTFVAFNLALAISRDRGRRVLLVDADLRASRLATHLGAPLAPGLSDYLRGAKQDLSIIQKDASGELFFLPAGEPVSNPTELLGAGRFKCLLKRVAPLFDWIIVDTPPVLPVSDASVLAGSCDGVLVVVRAAATASDQVEAALKELPAAKLLGVVLNGAEEELPRSAYTYYAGMAGGLPAASASPGSGSGFRNPR